MTVLRDVEAERARQDAQWGGPAHDDNHGPHHWVAFIERQLEKLDEPDVDADDPDAQAYLRFLKIAALGVAACEMLARHHQHDDATFRAQIQAVVARG